MSAQKSTAKGLLGGVLGTLGFSALAGLLVTVMVAPALAVTGMTANNSIGIFSSLPDYIELDSQHQVNQIVAIAADGSPRCTIAEVYDQNREEVTLDEISDNLKWAAIDGEDRRFYTHGGVDIPSVIRAAIGQVVRRRRQRWRLDPLHAARAQHPRAPCPQQRGLAAKRSVAKRRRRPSTPTSTASSRR